MKKKSFTRSVGVVLDDFLYEYLIEITDEEEMSKSEFMRKLVEDHFRVNNFDRYPKHRKEEYRNGK
jgi:hypothetical protein